MNQHRILNTSLDCISRFKSTQFPMRKVAKDLIAERKLNSTERARVLDIIFKWCRDSHLILSFLKKEIKFFQSMSTQQQDHLVISLLAESIIGDDFFDKNISSLAKKLAIDLANGGDNLNLIRLGNFLSGQFKHDYPDGAETLAQGLFAKPSNYLAFDRTQITREELVKKLAEHGIITSFHPMVPNAIRVDGRFLLEELPTDIQNFVWVMDAGSQMIAELIKPQAHEKILDMCVGEGGKAKLITLNPCHYVAIDVDERRLDKAKKRLAGQKNVDFLCLDATLAQAIKEESFDWVLLDAPCSGVGVIRRHPDIIHRLTKKDLDKTIALQHRLLMNAIKVIKPGGRIIYATCSLLKSENEQQIKRVLRENSKVIPLTLNHLVNEDLRFPAEDLDKFELTLLPHIHDCDGFYFAILEKTRE